MSWIKVDDSIYLHPKIVAAGNAATGAWLRMLAYCGNHLTDGKISATVAMMFVGGDAAPLDRLVSVGLLDRDADDYQVHDYLDYQQSRETVTANRGRDAQRKRASERTPAVIQTESERNPGRNPNGIREPDPNPISDPIPDPERERDQTRAREEKPSNGKRILSLDAFERVWCETLRLPVTGNHDVLHEAGRLCVVSAGLWKPPPESIEQHAGELMRAFSELVESWRAAGKPAPKNKSVEKFVFHFAAASEWLERAQRRCARANPEVADRGMPKHEPPPPEVLAELRRLSGREVDETDSEAEP